MTNANSETKDNLDKTLSTADGAVNIVSSETERVVNAILEGNDQVMGDLLNDKILWRSFLAHGGNFRFRKSCRKWLFFKKLSIEDEKSAFHDTLIRFREKVLSGEFSNGDFRAYIFVLGEGVYRNYSRVPKKPKQKGENAAQEQNRDSSKETPPSKIVNLDDPNVYLQLMDTEPIVEEDFTDKRLGQLQDMFESLGRGGEACYHIWLAFLEGLDYVEIVQRLQNITGKDSFTEVAARKRASDCRKRFREQFNIELPSKKAALRA